MPNQNQNQNDGLGSFIFRDWSLDGPLSSAEDLPPEITITPEITVVPLRDVLHDYCYDEVVINDDELDDASAQEVECDEEIEIDRSVLRDDSNARLAASVSDGPADGLAETLANLGTLQPIRVRRPSDYLAPPVPVSRRAREREQREQERHARLNRTEDSDWKQAARIVPEGGIPENPPTESVPDIDFDIMKTVKAVFADQLDWEVRCPEKTCQHTWIAPKAVTFWQAFEALGMLRDHNRFRPYYLRRMGREFAATGVMVTVAREDGHVRMFLHFPESQGQGCDGFNTIVDWMFNYVGPSESRWMEVDGIIAAAMSSDAADGCACEDCCAERTVRRRRRRDLGGEPDIVESVSGYPAKRTLRITW